MKKIIPITAGISLLGFLVSLILLFQSDYGLSMPFKMTCIFLSATITTFSFWKSNNSLAIGLVALIAFSAAILILFNTKLYINYWNHVLSLHVVLIGAALYYMSHFPIKNYFFKTTQIVILITTLLFLVTLVLKLENSILFTCLLVLLLVTSLLFIISQLVGIAKNKQE